MIIAGLGPGDLGRLPSPVADLLLDPAFTLVVRTADHPAAQDLAKRRHIEACDDLYATSDVFDQVYTRIAERVVDHAHRGPVVYAVPGSPFVGELAVARIRKAAEAESIPLEVLAAESFVDAILAAVDVDPLRDGFQLLNGHDLPSPLVVDKPTIVGHLDSPLVMADVKAQLQRIVPEDVTVSVVVDAGGPGMRLESGSIDDVDTRLAGNRTSLYLPAGPGGLVGAVYIMRTLREQCPWDRAQTHHSLVQNLIEESHELAEALSELPVGEEIDWVAYADVEDELGDVLLQVLFHAAIASQEGVFDVDDVGERLRTKLVRRHPHVFGDVEVESAAEVKANWDQIKQAERGGAPDSALDGVPAGMPALERAAKLQNRAAKVGFDWPDRQPVLAKVYEELAELNAVLDDPARVLDELGDVLFSVVNLARHLRADPEVALNRAIGRFERRFRAIEEMGPLDGLNLEELDLRWEAAKRAGH